MSNHIPSKLPGCYKAGVYIRGFPLLICLFLCICWLKIPVFADEALQSQPAMNHIEQTQESRKIHRTNALTDEEIAEGWVLIDGFAYPPEEAAGQTGYQITSTNGFSDEEYLSKVTFRADVQPGITEPIILYFTNEATYREYYVELYASNRYETSVMMAPGAYRFTGGGPENDDFSVFDVKSPLTFTVKYKEGLIVKPVIRSGGNIIQESIGIRTSEASEKQAAQQSIWESMGFDVTGSEADTETEVEAQETVERTEITWLDYLKISLILFILAIAAGAALLIYNKVKQAY